MWPRWFSFLSAIPSIFACPPCSASTSSRIDELPEFVVLTGRFMRISQYRELMPLFAECQTRHRPHENLSTPGTAQYITLAHDVITKKRRVRSTNKCTLYVPAKHQNFPMRLWFPRQNPLHQNYSDLSGRYGDCLAAASAEECQVAKSGRSMWKVISSYNGPTK